jgi:hypothetical protein
MTIIFFNGCLLLALSSNQQLAGRRTVNSHGDTDMSSGLLPNRFRTWRACSGHFISFHFMSCALRARNGTSAQSSL